MPDIKIFQEYAAVLSFSLKVLAVLQRKEYQDVNIMLDKNMQKKVEGRIATVS